MIMKVRIVAATLMALCLAVPIPPPACTQSVTATVIGSNCVSRNDSSFSKIPLGAKRGYGVMSAANIASDDDGSISQKGEVSSSDNAEEAETRDPLNDVLRKRGYGVMSGDTGITDESANLAKNALPERGYSVMSNGQTLARNEGSLRKKGPTAPSEAGEEVESLAIVKKALTDRGYGVMATSNSVPEDDNNSRRTFKETPAEMTNDIIGIFENDLNTQTEATELVRKSGFGLSKKGGSSLSSTDAIVTDGDIID